MSYAREIPRDLFNEASLLKGLGQLYLKLECAGPHRAELENDTGHGQFEIEQDQSSGAIYCWNVRLKIAGRPCHVIRPLNSRAPWPLLIEQIGDDWPDDPIPIFTEAGELSPEFLALIKEPS